MRKHLLEGHVAIDYIVAMSSGALRAAWTGGTELVAWIEEKNETEAEVGFLTRDAAIERLRGMAVTTERRDVGTLLASHAAELAKGATDKIQCVLHGWGASALLSLEPDDLRSGPIGGASVLRDFVALIDTASTKEGAVALIAEARAGLEAPVPELDRLVELVERWDVGLLSVGVTRASLAIEPQLLTPGGQRAKEILNALAQAASDRASGSGRHNAAGGSA
jgi:hypothetical protein